MNVARSLTYLGLLLVLVSFFLAWFPAGENLSALYYNNGQFNTAALLSSTNTAVTVAFILFPLGFVIAIWAAWRGRITSWIALILVPILAWLYNQAGQGMAMTSGPLLGLTGGVILTGAYVSNRWMYRLYFASGRGENPRPHGHHTTENRWDRTGRRRRPRFRGRLIQLGVLWVVLVFIGLLLGGDYPSSFPAYYWFLPGLVSLAIGAFEAIRIWRYASNVDNVRSAWTTRIVMTLGLFATGFLIFALFVSAALADASLLYAPYAVQSAVVNQAAVDSTGLLMSIVAFVVPAFFAFGVGEAYLIYRLRHHYTISRF